MSVNHLYFDIETVPDPTAAGLVVPPAEPDSGGAQKERIEVPPALDIDLCRVVAIGLARGDGDVTSSTGIGCVFERAALTVFWDQVRQPRTVLVGFNILKFDLPAMVRRSQYLDVKVAPVNIARYRHDGIVDLMQILSFDGLVRARKQTFYCQRFGLAAGADDHNTGANIGQLVEAGDWDAVRVHVRADVEKTRALYHAVMRTAA